MQSSEFPEGIDPRLEKNYFTQGTFVRKVITFFLRVLFSIITKMNFIGAENIPRQGAAIIAANHMTNFDVIPMQLASPRLIFYMGKAELFQNPVIDWIFRRLGGFPVYRGSHDEWAMNHARKVLNKGQLLGMFPEGTRSKGRGLRTAKTGAARLAIEKNVPIIPMAVIGTEKITRKFPHRTDVVIKIGKPLRPKAYETPLNLTDRVMYALADMLPDELKGVYSYRHPDFESQNHSQKTD